jgi:hypothetical protein
MTAHDNGYSARVRLELIVDGHVLSAARVYGRTCYLRQSIDCGPCEAELVISIDDRVRRKRVFLDQGGPTAEVYLRAS